MVFKDHPSTYTLGDRLLEPQERVIVGTRMGPSEVRRVASHLGVSKEQPALILQHKVWPNGSYLPTFMTKRCLDGDERFYRYKNNYKDEKGNLIFGYGLKERTVYIIHTPSNTLSMGDLFGRVGKIASAAKDAGANAVVLLAYTLDDDAQERGVHWENHPRMQSEKSKKSFDGQPLALRDVFLTLAMLGVDDVVVPHGHAPPDAEYLCNKVNERLESLSKIQRERGATLRYRIGYHNINVAPTIASLITEHSRQLQIDTSDYGKNLILLGADISTWPLVNEVRKESGLFKAGIAAMNKVKDEEGSLIETLTLEEADNLCPETGLEGKCVAVIDDLIRSGKTMRSNIDALCGHTVEGIKLDPRIKGRPKRVIVYSTRTNFAGNSVEILSSPFIDEVLITNADPRGFRNLGELGTKCTMAYINFMMAEAAKALEKGQSPNDVLTTEYIRERKLLRLTVPHDHISRSGRETGIF